MLCDLDAGWSGDRSGEGHAGEAASLLQPHLTAAELGGRAAGARALLQAKQLRKLTHKGTSLKQNQLN